MNSLKNELRFLFSGQGMPYEKVSIMVAIVVVIVFSLLLGNNKIKEAPVAVIDLDNSKYSHELIALIDASPFIKITTVCNTPAEPKTLFFQDANVAVLYLPQQLEKNHYSQTDGNIGVFYDNTNTAQTAEVKNTLNEILASENAKTAEDHTLGQIALHDRNLFNPSESGSNGETLGFLFFFSSMFFVFATIGMIPRLRQDGSLGQILSQGTPLTLLLKLLPYGGCLLTALFLGMAVLRLTGDLIFSGSIVFFLLVQLLYIAGLGMICLLFGWSAANPGIAASRMILFLPGGFILGGMTGPLAILSPWVRVISHFFPLVWEYHFVRDIMLRGAGFWDCSKILGAFLLYIAAVAVIFSLRFAGEKKKYLASAASPEAAGSEAAEAGVRCLP